MKRTLTILSLLTAALIAPTPASAQLGGLAKGAKSIARRTVEKAANTQKEKAQKKVKDATDKAKKKAMEKVLGAAGRPECPWTMSAEATYNGNDYSDPKNVNAYVWHLDQADTAEVRQLREQMDARFKSNMKLIKASEAGLITHDNPLAEEVDEAKRELERWEVFYHACTRPLKTYISELSVTKEGFDNIGKAKYLLTGNTGGGAGVYAVGTLTEGGRFVDLAGNGTYLDDNALTAAKQLVARMNNIKTLGYNRRGLFEETGYECDDPYVLYQYNLAGMYGGVTKLAIERNTPENIDRKARPKAGSLQGSLKAKALAVAKAENKDVTDVIITSDAWDVKRKGSVITHRNVYGYYLVKDAVGTKCLSRMWTQKHQGGGKYGALQAGGVGVEAEFYVK